MYTFLSPTPDRRLPKPYTWQALVRHPARKKRPREAEDPLLSFDLYEEHRADGQSVQCVYLPEPYTLRCLYLPGPYAPYSVYTFLSLTPSTWQALVRHPKKRKRAAEDPLLAFDAGNSWAAAERAGNSWAAVERAGNSSAARPSGNEGPGRTRLWKGAKEPQEEPKAVGKQARAPQLLSI